MNDSFSSKYKMNADGQQERSRNISHHVVKHLPCAMEAQIEITKQVLQLVKETGLPITQVNGQSKLGPPPNWVGPPPSPKCEVFVGKLPRDLYEFEIYPIFRRIGEIYEIRLMMDFSGTNRGYCFVMFTNVRDAQKAIRELNSYEIRTGKRIGVLASINNCRLCLTHLPALLNTEAFIKKIFETTDGVEKVAVYRLADERPKSALIFYKTHIAAAMARRRLVPERANLIYGAEITVDWAHPNLSPENIVEECGIIGKNGKLDISRRFIEFAKKIYARDGRRFNEKIQLSANNDSETISSELEKPSRMNMNKKKMNVRNRPFQNISSNLNPKIRPHYSNEFLSCENGWFIENIEAKAINETMNNCVCTNKIATTCQKGYQSSQITWVPWLFYADHFFCMPNDFYSISPDAQANYATNNPTNKIPKNNVLREMMTNIQTNWVLNQESKILKKKYIENIQEVAYNHRICTNEMITLKNDAVPNFKQPRPILNRLY